MVMAIMVSCFPAFHRSDQAELDWFARHRSDFEALRERFASDNKIDAVGYELTARDTVLPEDDFGEYRQAMQRLNVKLLVKDNRDPTRVRFIRTSGGDLGSGTAKGFEWSPAPITKLVESLDQARPARNQILYRRIDENWYLFYHYFN
jgi:hypothetical protein